VFIDHSLKRAFRCSSNVNRGVYRSLIKEVLTSADEVELTFLWCKSFFFLKSHYSI